MKEFSDAVRERLNNSFSGPYSLFFLIVHWKILVFLLTGNENSNDRVLNIGQYIEMSGKNLFLHPLWLTISYLVLVPIVVLFVDIYKDFISEKRIHIDTSYKHKFSVVKKLSETLLLRINACCNNGRATIDDLRDLQKYLNALNETNKKTILEHFYELRENKQI